MAQARFKTTYKRLLTAAAALALSITPIVSSVHAAYAATTTYTLKALSATVNGTSVTSAATVAASTQTTAQVAGICVRDANGANWDFPKSTNVVLKTTGTVLNGPQSTFSAGTYSYFACILVKNIWYQVGTAKSFTIASTTTGTTTPPSGSSYGSNALAQWNAALTNRNTQTATWVAWGDSFTEGQGASTAQNRWASKTLDSLRSTYATTGVTGGIGYLPAFYETYGPDSAWEPYATSGGNWAESTTGASLGNRLGVFQPGGYSTYNITGTSADIMYAVGGGTFTYKVDSGSAVTVNTTGATSPTGRTHVTFASAGTHALTVTGVTGTVYFQGVMAYNGDENKGIRLYEAGHTGATTGEFVNTSADMAKITAASSADLVTIELGANDFLNGPATPAQVATNLQAMISAIRSVSTAKQPSIVLVLPWSLAGNGGALGYTWQQYADAIRGVQTTDQSLGLLDLTSVATTNSTGGGLLAADGLHPSDSGHTAIANAVKSYLADL